MGAGQDRRVAEGPGVAASVVNLALAGPHDELRVRVYRPHDDAGALGLKLAAAHVPHRYILYPGAPHGFLKMAPEVEVAARAVRDAADHLREHWGA